MLEDKHHRRFKGLSVEETGAHQRDHVRHVLRAILAVLEQLLRLIGTREIQYPDVGCDADVRVVVMFKQNDSHE